MRFLSAYNKTLAKFGYPSGTLEELKASNSIDQTFSEKITCKKTATLAIGEFHNFFLQDKLSKEDVLPGARSLLYNLKQNKIPVAIVSNLDQALLGVQVKDVELDQYFKVIIGASNQMPPKPNPAMLIKALDRLGLVPSMRIYFVGDTHETDIICAKQANCSSVLISKQIYHKSNIIPDMQFNNIFQFSLLVDRHLNYKSLSHT